MTLTRPPRLVKLERETSILQLFPRNSCNEMFHVKHSEIAPRETTRNRFGKAGAHPQLALGIAIAPETLYLITTFRL